MQYPVGVVFFLKRFKIDVYITDNILFAFIMCMSTYGYMNAFKIKLFEISYIK